MPDNTTVHTATGRDLPRQDAARRDEYTLSIEDVATRYEHAGHPRTIRSIQRYCAKGHLDCLRQETAFGEKYVITPESVARHIAQIAELASTTGRDLSRQDAATLMPISGHDTVLPAPATSNDVTRQDATGRDLSQAPTPVTPTAGLDTRYVSQLERENEFLRDQIKIKDGQLTELTTRARETNFLIKGLQDLFLQLQPGRADRGNESRPHQATEATNKDVFGA